MCSTDTKRTDGRSSKWKGNIQFLDLCSRQNPSVWIALIAQESFCLEELGKERGDRSPQNEETVVGVVEKGMEKSKKALGRISPTYRIAMVSVLTPQWCLLPFGKLVLTLINFALCCLVRRDRRAPPSGYAYRLVSAGTSLGNNLSGLEDFLLEVRGLVQDLGEVWAKLARCLLLDQRALCLPRPALACAVLTNW